MTQEEYPELAQLRQRLSGVLLRQTDRHRPVRTLASLKRFPVAAIGLAVTGAAGVGVAIASSASGGGGVTPAQYRAGARAVVAPGVPANLSAAFGILGRPATGDDALPRAYVVEHAKGMLADAFGVNFRLARRARVASGRAWVVPGDSTVCLVVSAFANAQVTGSGCSPASAAIKGESLIISGAPASRQFVAGLVPNGVRRVQLHLNSGVVRSLPVQDNVYSVSLVGSGVQSVAFSGPDGPVTLDAAGR